MSKCFHLSCSCLFSLGRNILWREEGWKTYHLMVTLPLTTLNTFLKLLKDINGFSAILIYHILRKLVNHVSKQQMLSKSNLHLKMRQSCGDQACPRGCQDNSIQESRELLRDTMRALFTSSMFPSFCQTPASLACTANLTKVSLDYVMLSFPQSCGIVPSSREHLEF